MTDEFAPTIMRDFPPNASVEAQVQEFYDRWSAYNDCRQTFEQVERNMHFAARTGTGLIGDPAFVRKSQEERSAAIPILKLAVLEAIERVEKLPDKALRALSEKDRIKLRWALLSLRQERTREEELTQLQEQYQTQGRIDDRER